MEYTDTTDSKYYTPRQSWYHVQKHIVDMLVMQHGH